MKRKNSLLWCHYKFNSGREDNHQMLYPNTHTHIYIYIYVYIYIYIYIYIYYMLYICIYTTHTHTHTHTHIYIYIYIYIYYMLYIRNLYTSAFNNFPDFFCTGIENCHRLLKIQYAIAIHLMRWLPNFYDFSFKWTATTGIGIHPTKAWLSQLVTPATNVLDMTLNSLMVRPQ